MENKNYFNAMKCMMTAILFIGIGINAQAQSNTNSDVTTEDIQTESKTVSVKCCKSYEDFKANEWEIISPVTMVTKSRNKQIWLGGRSIKFDSEDKDIKKQLNRKTFAIVYDNRLYLSTRKYRDKLFRFGADFAQAYTMKDGHFIIIYRNENKIMGQQIIGGTLFGTIGAVATASSATETAKYDVCYIITPGDKKAQIINDKKIEEMLSGHPELLQQYKVSTDKDERMSAENVLPLLEKAGLLNSEYIVK